MNLPIGHCLMLQNALAAIAETYVGLTEVGGDNQGQMVERFQRAVDGKAQKEAWCLALVWHCILEAQVLCEKITMQSFEEQPELFKTEHVMTMWNKSPKIQRITEPAPGVLALWQHFKNGKATGMGHVGIITRHITGTSVLDVEGNTSNPDHGMVRNGDGIYLKKRDLKYYYGSLRPVGLLSVW